MSAHARTERREPRLARLATYFRTRPSSPADPRMMVPPGMPGTDTRTWLPGPPFAVACKACSPLDSGPCTCPQDCGHLSCTAAWREVPPQQRREDQRDVETVTMPVPASLAETEAWGPWDKPADLYMDVRDEYVPPARPYLPEIEHTPDLCADLADLPAFREALGRRTRCHAGECLCGHPVSGDTWGERMVRAGIHLLASEGDAA